MPRSARTISEDGAPYHVTCRGNNRAEIFHDDEDREVFLHNIGSCKKQEPFDLYHYCIMGNHYHLEMAPASPDSLARIMRTINLSYSLHYKKKYGFLGQLWQGRFHSRVITDQRYLSTCGIYIELNPVRAGIVEAPEKYQWSSYGAYALAAHDRLVSFDPVYLDLGRNGEERRSEYRAMTSMWQLHPIDRKQAKKIFL